MSERAPYSRVYWTIRSDERTRALYTDDHALAAWLRLLIAADMAWPAPADLPVGVNRKALAALVSAGVIEVQGSLFRFHGLDAERGRRRASARDASAARWGTERTPEAIQTDTESSPRAGGRLGSSRLAIESTTPESLDDGGVQGGSADRDPDPADAYWTLTGRYPTDKPLAWIDQLTREYGAVPVIRAIADAHGADGSASSLLGRAQDRLRRGARALDLAAQRAEQERIAAVRSAPRAEPDRASINAVMAKLLGGHPDAAA